LKKKKFWKNPGEKRPPQPLVFGEVPTFQKLQQKAPKRNPSLVLAKTGENLITRKFLRAGTRGKRGKRGWFVFFLQTMSQKPQREGTARYNIFITTKEPGGPAKGKKIKGVQQKQGGQKRGFRDKRLGF